VVHVDPEIAVASMVDVVVTDAEGPDLWGLVDERVGVVVP
jgi:hypothetical protein